MVQLTSKKLMPVLPQTGDCRSWTTRVRYLMRAAGTMLNLINVRVSVFGTSYCSIFIEKCCMAIAYYHRRAHSHLAAARTSTIMHTQRIKQNHGPTMSILVVGDANAD